MLPLASCITGGSTQFTLIHQLRICFYHWWESCELRWGSGGRGMESFAGVRWVTQGVGAQSLVWVLLIAAWYLPPPVPWKTGPHLGPGLTSSWHHLGFYCDEIAVTRQLRTCFLPTSAHGICIHLCLLSSVCTFCPQALLGLQSWLRTQPAHT